MWYKLHKMSTLKSCLPAGWAFTSDKRWQLLIVVFRGINCLPPPFLHIQVLHGDSYGLPDRVPSEPSLHLQLWITVYRLLWVRKSLLTVLPHFFATPCWWQHTALVTSDFLCYQLLFLCLLTVRSGTSLCKYKTTDYKAAGLFTVDIVHPGMVKVLGASWQLYVCCLNKAAAEVVGSLSTGLLFHTFVLTQTLHFPFLTAQRMIKQGSK